MPEENNQPAVSTAAPTYQLEPHMAARIARALRRAGDFGEVHLIVDKGQVKFIKIVVSESLNIVKR